MYAINNYPHPALFTRLHTMRLEREALSHPGALDMKVHLSYQRAVNFLSRFMRKKSSLF